MVPRAGVWAGFASKTPTPKLIVVSSHYETSDFPETKSQAPMNAHHYKAAYWIGQGVFDGLTSFTEFEARVNDIFEEKDRGGRLRDFYRGLSSDTDYHAARKALGCWRYSSRHA
jgi:hypothetical protein